jgi:putative flippase GtrA
LSSRWLPNLKDPGALSGDGPPAQDRPKLPLADLAELVGSEAFRQLVRFMVAGMAVTLLSAAIYSALVQVSMAPLAANVVSHGCGMAVGYAVHSRWSFNADTDGGERAMIVRFLVASGFAFLLNSLWVWLAIAAMGLPPLAPLPAMVVLTPLCSFILNRTWVFRAA